MTLKPIFSIVAVALCLSACGGGGGDTIILSPTASNNQNPTATHNQNNNSNTSNPSTNNNANNNNANNNIGGNLSGKDTSKPSTPSTFNTSIQGLTAQASNGVSNIGASRATANISTVVIDGKNIALGSNLKSGTSLSSVRYGYLNQNGSTPSLIVQGLAATQMPNTGKATYQGSAVHLTTSNGNASSQVASARFTADFDKKTLTGTIRVANPVNLGATIAGNRFSGVLGDFATSGYFYGEKADELGGLYKNSDGTIGGAYGAKK